MLELNLLHVALVYTLGMLVPGPNFFLILSNGMNYGRNAGFLTSSGVVLGTMIWVLLSLTSIGLLVKSLPTLFFGLKLFGGSYLIYLAATKFQSILTKEKTGTSIPRQELSDKEIQRHTQLFLQGLMVNLLNPKSLLFWFAIFSSLPLYLVSQYAAIVAIVLTISFAYHSSLGLFAGELGKRLVGDVWGCGINAISAVAFLLFGFFILFGLIPI